MLKRSVSDPSCCQTSSNHVLAAVAPRAKLPLRIPVLEDALRMLDDEIEDLEGEVQREEEDRRRRKRRLEGGEVTVCALKTFPVASFLTSGSLKSLADRRGVKCEIASAATREMVGRGGSWKEMTMRSRWIGG